MFVESMGNEEDTGCVVLIESVEHLKALIVDYGGRVTSVSGQSYRTADSYSRKFLRTIEVAPIP